MTPIYLEFSHAGDRWSGLLHADAGRCDLWRDLAFVGSVTVAPGGGFAVVPPALRPLLPVFAEQMRPYLPLLQHEGRREAPRRRTSRVLAMGA